MALNSKIDNNQLGSLTFSRKILAQKNKEKTTEDVSLIAKSCGIVIAPSKDDLILQRIEREKKAKEAKEKAAEIFKKSQKAKQNKLQKRFKRPKRVELKSGHGLSESDSD